ncbi:flagellar biosynthetic protein FliO [Nitrospira sp. KM1]|uniref:FliO/MopB family protein n=1 Tax=Nitrospira sp. KM1 TaxID=1936990 RepID=UPI001567B45D|nr:flagellar biosynthetic protein FliO [Nitrospira sp. KM1]
MATRMLSSLALVIALMLILAAVARRLLGTRLPVQTAVPLVRVIGSGYLGPRKTVSLVSVAGEILVVGTTQHDIVPLGRLSDPEQIQHALAQAPPHSQLTDGTLWTRLWQGWARTAITAPRPSFPHADDRATPQTGEHAAF